MTPIGDTTMALETFKPRRNSLGVIYIQTRFDDPKQFERVRQEIAETVTEDFLMIVVDGDSIPDITTCLNIGIQQCIDNGLQYIHWAHGDMFYTKHPDWYVQLRLKLQAFPEILKICASNSRDEIHPLRIGQEQTWLMRTLDFIRLPWLWFDERYIRCGGREDYAQHVNILARGYLILITPDAQIFHKGAQTRSQYDSNPHQQYNDGVFGMTSGYGGLVEVHKKEYYGAFLRDGSEYQFMFAQVNPLIRKQLELLDGSYLARVRETREVIQAMWPVRTGSTVPSIQSL